VRCPRCRRETSDPAPAYCRECGAPLRLHDEPATRSLDASVGIDRRGRESASEASPAELAALERSHWDLGLAAATVTPAAVAAPVPAVESGAEADSQWRGLPRDDAFPDAEVDALEIHLRRPPSWRRAAAAAVDGLPFVAGGIALARALVREAGSGLPAPPTGLDGLLDLVARERVIVFSIAAAMILALAVYATLAHALAGATLGKRLLGLRVVGPDGARPSMARSAARAALALVSVGLLGLGVLLALFTRSGRALHDLLVRTWVVEAP